MVYWSLVLLPRGEGNLSNSSLNQMFWYSPKKRRLAMANKHTVLRPSFPGSVSHVKGVERDRVRWHGLRPRTPNTSLSHTSPPHLTTTTPRRRHAQGKCIHSLTSSLCFNHRSINDVGGSGIGRTE